MPVLERQSNRIHKPDRFDPRGYDFTIVGGGPIGIMTAWELNKRMGKDARLLLITQEDDFGGTAKKALQQQRPAHTTQELTRGVFQTSQQYDELEAESGLILRITYPYILTENSPAQRGFYTDVIRKSTEWSACLGAKNKAEFLEYDELHYRYPFIDNDNLNGGAVFHDCGRLDFDSAKDIAMKLSSQTTFASGVRLKEVLLDKNGRLLGLDTTSGVINTGHTVLALGAFILNIQEYMPEVDLQKLRDSVTVKKRELFTAPLQNIPTRREAQKAFVISPGMAIAVLETDAHGNGVGTYGYADPNDTASTHPEVDPQPQKDPEMRFPGITYGNLSGAMTMFNLDTGTQAFAPVRQWAGYYTALADNHPAFGPPAIGTEGVTLMAGLHHFGVMETGLVRDGVEYILYKKPIAERLNSMRDIIPDESGLEL